MKGRKGKKTRGILLDCDYREKEGKSRISLFVKADRKIEEFVDREYKPYFYALAEDGFDEKTLLEREFGEGARIVEAKKTMRGKELAIQLFFESTKDLVACRQEIKSVRGIRDKREHDIPFAKRYLIDKALEPMNGIELEFDSKGGIRKARSFDEKEPGLRMCAFDIETYSPERFPNPKKDPITMISLADEKKARVFTTAKKLSGKEWCTVLGSEKAMIEAFLQEIRLSGFDIIVTYNGDSFDFPYIKERANQLGVDFGINSDGSAPKAQRKGTDSAFRLTGIQHLDAFQLITFLVRFQVINLVKYDLESVSEALLGKPKKKVHFSQINEAWRTGEGIEELAEYNREDSEAALELAKKYFPLCIETSRLVKQPLYDSTRISGGMLVEYLLISKSFKEGLLVPNKPSESETQSRAGSNVQGAFVKEPIPGIHENMAMLDFRSFHPSIMIRHNISPETLDCRHNECSSGKNVSPTGHWFCEKNSGFITGAIEEVMKQRVKWKEEYKKTPKDSPVKDLMYARQWALKIALNSFFGYMGYARSRWYCRECGRSILAWTRYYIKDISAKAERDGFTVIYNDTDSCLIKLNDKPRDDVKKFAEKINGEMMKPMELELENYFKRGIFVSTKEGKTAAKKRYALMDWEDNLKIVGFEYVRRDWSRIAKETQKSVIESILKRGDPENAARTVKTAIQELRTGNVPKKELVIYSQIQKPLEKYDAIGPHVSAAMKARKKGKGIETGSIIGYIITRNGKTISERAEMEEFVHEGNYDPEYYISHQLIPSVKRIMAQLGYSEEDLLHGGKQTKLF